MHFAVRSNMLRVHLMKLIHVIKCCSETVSRWRCVQSVEVAEFESDQVGRGIAVVMRKKHSLTSTCGSRNSGRVKLDVWPKGVLCVLRCTLTTLIRIFFFISLKYRLPATSQTNSFPSEPRLTSRTSSFFLFLFQDMWTRTDKKKSLYVEPLAASVNIGVFSVDTGFSFKILWKATPVFNPRIHSFRD